MKKFIIVLLISMFAIAIHAFAKQVCMEFDWVRAKDDIQRIIDAGYKVVTMTRSGDYTVIVVFEKEEE